MGSAHDQYMVCEWRGAAPARLCATTARRLSCLRTRVLRMRTLHTRADSSDRIYAIYVPPKPHFAARWPFGLCPLRVLHSQALPLGRWGEIYRIAFESEYRDSLSLSVLGIPTVTLSRSIAGRSCAATVQRIRPSLSTVASRANARTMCNYFRSGGV
jgi:hypothetical protein